MNPDTLPYLQSEKLALTRLLELTPLDQVIERTGFEHRLLEIENALGGIAALNPAPSSAEDLLDVAHNHDKVGFGESGHGELRPQPEYSPF